jgi:two-component system, chemotaxis family, sensor kinase CheA
VAPDRKYLALFVAESREQLAALGSELVSLEARSAEEAPPPPASWDSIFRRVHSIKGSAATLELEGLVQVAHAAEALTSRLRAAGQRVERGQIDLLLEAADALSRLLEQAAREEPLDAQAQLAARLEEAAGRLQPAEKARPGELKASEQRAGDQKAGERPGELKASELKSSEQRSGEQKASDQKPGEPKQDPAPAAPARELLITLSSKCAAPGARALIVQRKLKALGQLVEMEPSPQQLMQTRGGARIRARLATVKGPEEIRAACRSVPEVGGLGGEKVTHVAAEEPRPKATPASDPQAQATPAPPPREERRNDSTVRVRADALDQLLDAAGEVLGGIARLREHARQLPESVGPSFEQEIDRLRRQARELHGKVMNARLTPFSVLTERLPRSVRDLAHRLGKEADLEVLGADVELDRSMIEAMGDPLSHLVRNAVDHGIEAPGARQAQGKPPRGKLTLRARRERDRVLIDLEDDGRGIDTQALRRLSVATGALTAEAAAGLTEAKAAELAFLPGLTTRKEATEISGRGVGLDAVLRSVESVGGRLSVASRAGRGTQFTLELPRSVSMANLLLVMVGSEVYGLPVHRVVLTVEDDPGARGGEGFESRSVIVAGQRVPSWSLGKLFGQPTLSPPGLRPFVVLEVDGAAFALAVDRLIGQEEAVVRPLFPPLDRIQGLAGTCVLGSGRPLLVLDPRGIADMAGVPRGPGPAREPALQGAA